MISALEPKGGPRPYLPVTYSKDVLRRFLATNEGPFPGDPLTAGAAFSDYHVYMNTRSGEPTESVRKVWEAHLLLTGSYADYCNNRFRKFIDYAPA